MAAAGRFSLVDLGRELVTSSRRVRRVLPLISRRHKLMLLAATGFMVLASILSTAVPVFFGWLINRVNEVLGGNPSSQRLFAVSWPYLALIGAAYLLREVVVVGQRFLVQTACTRIERDLTVLAVSRLFKADLSVFTGERVGGLQGRISRSVDGFVFFVNQGFTTILSGIIAIVVSLAYVFFVNDLVGLVMLAVLPLYVALTLHQVSAHQNTRRAILRSKETLDGTVVERLGGLEYIRAADTGRREVDRVEAAAEQQRRQKMSYQLSMAGYDAIKAVNEGFFHLLVLGLALYLLAHRDTYTLFGRPFEPGDILAFSMLFYRVVAPLKALQPMLDQVQESSLRVDDLMRLLEKEPDPSFNFSNEESGRLTVFDRARQLFWPDRPPAPAPPAAEPRLVKGEPLIDIHNLVVDYPTPDGGKRRALRGVSLVVPHGRTLGVAGPAGSGKSTWLKVLLRLTHPEAGRVFLGGVPLEEIDRATIGRLFGYVSQTPFLFAGTVAENIAYGSEGATPEQVRRAAELARIHDEIMAMPAYYQSLVAERGQNLSGGQRQRIALARVFLKNPPILILDEGTSALDNINEKAIQEALAATRSDRTTILVAHRLTTLRDADEVLVFDQGQIVEHGSFSDLEHGGGLFARLVRSAGESHAAAS